MALAEGKGLEARIERHGGKWRVTLHNDDGEDDSWMVTRLETF